MNFLSKLGEKVTDHDSLVCVGLDSAIEKIPEHIRQNAHPQFEFNREIIDATHDLVCAYKPNIAFYEAEGVKGLEDLKMTMDYLKNNFPETPVIIDAKRGDIGNTNDGYVSFIFDYLGADAITLHPYMGWESLKPFLDRGEKGLFILCRTSNSGAGEFQDLMIDGMPLYQKVAHQVIDKWNYNKNCGLVVGATYPEELRKIRHIVQDMPLLIPGVGAQGGDVEATVKAGVDKHGKNAIINSSRGIIFASSDKDFAKKARIETEKLRNMINKFRKV